MPNLMWWRRFAFDRGAMILAGFGYHGIARLKPGMTIPEADADMARMLPIWMDSWTNGPKSNPHIYQTWKITPMIRPLKQEVVGSVSEAPARGDGDDWRGDVDCLRQRGEFAAREGRVRQQELAVRAALGAGWGRIVRGLLVESVMLGLTGGALGAGFAYAGVRFLLSLGSANLPRLNEISLDARTLGFTLLLSVFSGLLFGLIPALKYTGPRTSLALRSAGRTISVSRERHRARNMLVIGQVAMAFVLLVSAGLMMRTFEALRTVEPGFTDARHLQLMRISIPDSLVAEPERVTRIQKQILDKLSAIPGVHRPGSSAKCRWKGSTRAGTPSMRKTRPIRWTQSRRCGYSGTSRPVSFRRPEQDCRGPRNDLGRNIWPESGGDGFRKSGSRALGYTNRRDRKAHNGISWMPWHEVIGVIEDVHEVGVQEQAPEIVYWPPIMGNLFGPGPVQAVRTMTFAIRSERTGTEGFLNEVRKRCGR